MPPGTAETMHYHQLAKQFFFIRKGEATFHIDNTNSTVQENQGLLIQPGQRHRILNCTEETLEFLVISQPSALNDRFNCE